MINLTIIQNQLIQKKVGELFSIIDNMNTDEILQFNLKYNIPLSVTDNNGNNLIHRVLLDSNSLTMK